VTPSTRAAGPSASVIALITTLSLILSLFASVPVARATHTNGPLVDPDPHPGSANQECGDFEGDYQFEFKVDEDKSPTGLNGTFKQGDTGVDVSANTDFQVTLSVSGNKLSFAANFPVQTVFVKGGPVGGHLYDYTTLAFPVNHDNGLTVMPSATGQLYGISHVSFCFDEPPKFPALKVEKTPDGGIIDAGQNLSFTIKVTNTGDAAAANVKVTDDLDTRFTWSHNQAGTCSIESSKLLCTIASLAAGASFTVTVTAPTTGSVCGAIPNVASASADGLNPVNDPGDITIRCAQINLAKTPDGGWVEIDGAITFAIVASNSGQAAAQGVEVFDDLPGTGWSIVGGAATTLLNCAISSAAHPSLGNIGQWLSCPNNTIAAGGSAKVTVTKTAAYPGDCGRIDNTASVTTTNDGSDSDPGHVTVLCADIEVDKTPDDGTVDAGGLATFTITVSNTGDATATGVELTDQLPATAAGWTILSSDWPAAPAAGACEISAGGLLECGPVSLAAGGSLVLVVQSRTTLDDCGVLDNPVASVTTTNDGSDEDGGKITVLCPELNILKSTTTPAVNAGDLVSYTITLQNDGDGAAHGIMLTDQLPDGITWSVEKAGCDIVANELSCDVGTLASGASYSVTVTGTAGADECPSIANTASFTSSNAGSGSTSEAPTTITVNCPDLELEKTGSEVVVAGGTAFHTITVTNHDDGDAYDVVLTDHLPNIVTGGWEVTATTGIPMAACDVASNTLTCELDVLDSGASFSVTVSAEVAASDCPSLLNEASVAASNEPSDKLGDNSGEHEIAVECPDTSVTKEATTPVVDAGMTATFEIVVSAGGTGTNENVVLVDHLIGSADDWDYSVSGGGATDDDCAILDDPSLYLRCEFGDLEPGVSVTVTLTYQTDADDCPSIANAATVTALNDVDGSNNESELATVDVDCPDLKITKEAAASPISAGELAEFAITIWNVGPGTAYDVELVDTLPAGTLWTLLDDDGMTCSTSLVPGQQTITCTLGELAPGEENARTVRIGYETSQDDCGVLENAVTVAGGNEPSDKAGSDNADEASIIVECPGLNMLKTADADPIIAGETASYTITVWNAGPGTAFDVTIEDTIPAGWTFDDSACDSAASSLEEGGMESWSCTINALGVSDMAGGVQIKISGPTTRDDCGLLTNTAFASASNADDELERSDTITVMCPELVLDKEADADEIVISGPNDDLQADPAVITWTLTYTLTDGPVTNAVITDELPMGLVYVPGSASDGGVYDEATNTLTWTFPTLSESGSVTYQTAVDPETISRVDPTVNVAVISSDQTPEDEGQDQVSVVVDPPPLGGTPTPRPSMPDTATGFGPNGEPITVPVELLVVVFLGSLGALALANVRTARSRGR
jgi:uncharacterized repeat protein (TIGR01451 family)